MCNSIFGGPARGTLITQPLSYTILNVDDNDAGRYAKRRTLERAGYRVVEASTARRGSSPCGSAIKPQLVLLDVKLPDMSGLDVCRMHQNGPIDLRRSRLADFSFADYARGPGVRLGRWRRRLLNRAGGSQRAGRNRARIAAAIQPRTRKPRVSSLPCATARRSFAPASSWPVSARRKSTLQRENSCVSMTAIASWLDILRQN